MARNRLLLVAALSLALIPALAGADAETIAQDEQVLTKAGFSVDGKALVEFFRQRTGSEADRARGRELVKQLGDDSFTVREKAFTGLVDLGWPALPALRKAMADPDREQAQRAAECVRKIETESGPVLAAAATR